ncbi:hypothetical protein BH23CHL5_BH23CHL5_23520 [soil metagenome]
MSLEDQISPDSLLKESEERYRVLFEDVSDVIQSVRPDGSFEFVNKAWHDMLGYDDVELSGMIIWDVIHPESRPECEVHFAAAMQGLPVVDVRADFIDKQGNKIPVEGNAHSRSVDGKIVATHTFFRDIRERLRTEDLVAQNARLEQEQQARYLEKMAALGKLSAGLSHELNNPAAAAQRSSNRLSESLTARDEAAKILTSQEISGEAWSNLEALVNRRVV